MRRIPLRRYVSLRRLVPPQPLRARTRHLPTHMPLQFLVTSRQPPVPPPSRNAAFIRRVSFRGLSCRGTRFAVIGNRFLLERPAKTAGSGFALHFRRQLGRSGGRTVDGHPSRRCSCIALYQPRRKAHRARRTGCATVAFPDFGFLSSWGLLHVFAPFALGH